MGIDDRKQRVLRAIVMLYGNAGEPVGSGLLAEYFDRAVSSATLRNEMAALTKLGLLEQPHTSAGRVPSPKGYRFYLDHLLELSTGLSLREKAEIDTLFDELDYDPEHLAGGAARALADFTGYTVLTTTPGSEEACMAHYEVIQVGLSTAAVLAVTNAGSVRTRTAKLDFALRAEDVARLKKALNTYLTFRNAADVSETLLREAAAELGTDGALAYPVFSAALTLLRECGRPRVFLEGQQYLLDRNVPAGSFRAFMALYSDADAARACLTPCSSRTAIVLGEDIPDYPMPELCLMSKQYVAGGGRTGVISIVGPTRMPYRELVPRLEYFALRLGECMSGKGLQEER